MQDIDICEYMGRRNERDLIIDVRDKTLFMLGTIQGAINIPLDNIGELYSLPKDRDIYVFCQQGEFSGEVVELLTDAGYNAFNLTGGYRQYIRYVMSKKE